MEDECLNAIVESANHVTVLTGYIPSYVHQFRVCIVGDAYVGKTSLMRRYYDNKFSEDYINTIGCDFKVVTMDVSGKIVKLQIWDTAGQERFRAISINYFRSAQSFIFVFDLSCITSFNNLESWIEIATKTNPKFIKNILIGNKSDIITRAVDRAQALDFAKLHNMLYIETSAMNDTMVKEAFNYLAYELTSRSSDLLNNPPEEKLELEIDGNKVKTEESKGKCCS